MSNERRSRTGRRAIGDALWGPSRKAGREGQFSAVPLPHRAVLQALMEMEPIGGWDAQTWTVDVTWAELATWLCSTRQTLTRLVADLIHNGWIGGRVPTRGTSGRFTLFIPEHPDHWEDAPERQKARSASAERTAAQRGRIAASAHGRSTAAHGGSQQPHTAVQRPHTAVELSDEQPHTDVDLNVSAGQGPSAPGWVGVVPTVPTHNYGPPAERAAEGGPVTVTAAAARPALRAPGAQGRPGRLPINETSAHLPREGALTMDSNSNHPRAGARPGAGAVDLPLNLEHLATFDPRVRSAELGRLAPISLQVLYSELHGHQDDHDGRCGTCRSGYHCVEAITLGSLTGRLDACLRGPGHAP